MKILLPNRKRGGMVERFVCSVEKRSDVYRFCTPDVSMGLKSDPPNNVEDQRP